MHLQDTLIRQLPNLLTTLRLLLAIPLCLLVLKENFEAVLWVAFFAGASDGIDGWLARKLDATSRYGAVVDPLADKVMLSGIYPCLAAVALLPWWVALLVIGRDMIIVLGALAYQGLYGRYDMQPSALGKASTFLQIILALAILVQQVLPATPTVVLLMLQYLVVVATVVSGCHYVAVWGLRAVRRSAGSQADQSRRR
jgi:cardiolipin synthase